MNRRPRQPDPDESWTGAAAPNTRPHPERERFDNLLTDPRHYRGDYRMMCTAVRRHRMDGATEEDRAALVGKLFSANPMTDPVKLSDLKRISLTLAGAWAMIDMDRDNHRLRCHIEWPTERRGRNRWRWEARDLPRIDAHSWRKDVLGRPVAQWSVAYFAHIRILGDDGNAVTIQAARLFIRLRPVGGPRVLFECPGCLRPCRYLYAGLHGLTCRVGLGLVYRPRPRTLGGDRRW